MKKLMFLLLIVTDYSCAQLNLEWGSYLTLEHPAVNDTYQFGSRFGYDLASINDELLISAPYYDINGNEEAGRIFYLKSAPNGSIKPLEWVLGNGRYSQSSIPGATPEVFDVFGHSVSIVATASNASKILIGVPYEDIGSISNAGMIHEMFIDSQGVDFLNYHQDTSDVEGTAESNDLMGFSVAWGDFDDDGNIDAAIGSPGETVNISEEAGAVNVIMGGSDGMLDPQNSQFWTQASLFIEGTVNSGDDFGKVLAVGDFDDDGRSDLAIGVPGDRVDGLSDAGSVNVIYGGNDGLGATGDQLWNQNSTDIGGGSEAGDRFGSSLAVGDFNGDGVDDLAIGVQDEAIGNDNNAGGINIIYGEAGEGLVSSGNQFISQATSGFLGAAEPGDRFGSSLATGLLNNDGYHDLAIGAPSEDFGDVVNAGAVYVVHGSSGGLQFNDEYIISESYFSVPGGRRANRNFGSSLSISDFDNDNKYDLAIGTRPSSPTSSNDYAVVVAYRINHDPIFKNGFE